MKKAPKLPVVEFDGIPKDADTVAKQPEF